MSISGQIRHRNAKLYNINKVRKFIKPIYEIAVLF